MEQPDSAAMRRVLMVAFHFPPLAGSSGIQRTLRFVQHLGAHGWRADVLGAHQRAFERVSDDLLADVPPGTVVERAQAWDAARHFAIAGRYKASWAIPDRWKTWRLDAVRTGLGMIRKYQHKVIWCTYPVPTALVIGRELARRTGLPWVADFRDPMAQPGFPADPRKWDSFNAIERQTVAEADCCVFTTRGAAAEYQSRYPASAEHLHVIENGYDEESFAGLAEEPAPLNPGMTTILHSGVVYGIERDPTHLFTALRQLHDQGRISPERLRLRFRASGVDAFLHDKAQTHGVEAFIELMPPLPYRQALQEMRRADGLLVLQAANCNDQIPAKLYEYLRAGRPLLCLTDPAGDTAAVARSAGVYTIAALDSVHAITALLTEWLDKSSRLRDSPDPAVVTGFSRASRARELAALLDRLAARPLGTAGTSPASPNLESLS